jgi:catechol 2,3-dioxygenase-like lactoylglutathione lyase family enzyme
MTNRPALRLDRNSLNVADLAAAVEFYTQALGFEATAAVDADSRLASLLGARALRVVLMRRGAQRLELAMFDPPGAAYPAGSRSNDLWFQHCALATNDIGAAYRRLSRFPFTAISRHGPQPLPGGILAFKFRDPEGHPLELIEFPRPDPTTEGGIDHSAISVADAQRSIAFYATRLGLRAQSRQVNSGPAQDALDDLHAVAVDVVSLAAKAPAPHVELLGYRAPPGRASAMTPPSAIAASRLVFAVDALDGENDAVALAGGVRACLIRDPDGHNLLLEEAAESARYAGAGGRTRLSFWRRRVRHFSLPPET